MSALISTMTSKGQVTIPKKVRDALRLLSGDKVEFIRNVNNEIVLKPVTKKAVEVAGILSNYKKKEVVSLETMDQTVKHYLKNKHS